MTSGSRTLPPALLALVLLLDATAASATPSAPDSAEQRPTARVPVAGVVEHLRAFQEIADRNGGNRLAGTAGYDASARYVARRMRAAGYRVRFQELSFPLVVDRSPQCCAREPYGLENGLGHELNPGPTPAR